MPRYASACKFDRAESLTQVVRYMLGNLHNELSAPALAAEFSLTEEPLLHLFESHTGIALAEYVLRRRIERALELLKGQHISESEIAKRFGWGAQSSLQAAFSNYLGITPREYRCSLFATQP